MAGSQARFLRADQGSRKPSPWDLSGVQSPFPRHITPLFVAACRALRPCRWRDKLTNRTNHTIHWRDVSYCGETARIWRVLALFRIGWSIAFGTRSGLPPTISGALGIPNSPVRCRRDSTRARPAPTSTLACSIPMRTTPTACMALIRFKWCSTTPDTWPIAPAGSMRPIKRS